MSKLQQSWIKANWPTPPNIIAGCTTRQGGFSENNYRSFNLAQHVGDDAKKVDANREYLSHLLDLPNQPFWLQQVHGDHVIKHDGSAQDNIGDAAFTALPNQVCVVMIGDCLPILLTSQHGDCVAAIHGGWRSLSLNIIEKTIQAMASNDTPLMAWLGPSISPQLFEIGPEVREKFLELDSELAKVFKPGQGDRFYADIYQIASFLLQRCGVNQIYGGGFCTISDSERFFSYRRDKQTGRMAALIYKTS